MDVMRTMGLDKIRETAGAANARYGRDFLMKHLPLFDQLKIKRQHREIAAARAPRRLVSREFFFRKTLAVIFGKDWRRNRQNVSGTAIGNFSFCIVHCFQDWL